jgi:hypothetical protein
MFHKILGNTLKNIIENEIKCADYFNFHSNYNMASSIEIYLYIWNRLIIDKAVSSDDIVLSNC